MILEIELRSGLHGFAESSALSWRGLEVGQALEWGVLWMAQVYIVGEIGIVEELELKGIQHIGGPEDADKKIELKPGFALPHDESVRRLCSPWLFSQCWMHACWDQGQQATMPATSAHCAPEARTASTLRGPHQCQQHSVLQYFDVGGLKGDKWADVPHCLERVPQAEHGLPAGGRSGGGLRQAPQLPQDPVRHAVHQREPGLPLHRDQPGRQDAPDRRAGVGGERCHGGRHQRRALPPEPPLCCPLTARVSGLLCTSGASPVPRIQAVRCSAERGGPVDLCRGHQKRQNCVHLIVLVVFQSSCWPCFMTHLINPA